MTPMLDALHAPQPQPALAEKLGLYGQFVGSWNLDVDYRPFSAAPVRGQGECHFGWVLDGRAVQDVWIRRGPATAPDKYGFYDTTYRWYDPAIDAWHIHWFEPNRLVASHQIGRAQGPDIVQVGETNGLMRRWRFTEITDRSFRWIGDASWDHGATWTLELEMHARRTQ
jgi:hypothetical protein